ncbi:hypothetical protein [Methylobacterium sp. NEAU K]|uniref:hypothetical protein n=1 Tax=Methylobacterium sp. NEAU K TaxID=3064946 RepID=UPI002735F8EC|nr:hypothetical protein [Methylobacterium sp. NEAU K]MDP4003736.1 hypothetical protein [Methylobacterium sp. NEAU K]
MSRPGVEGGELPDDRAERTEETEATMLKGGLLWLLGIPIPIILLLWFLGVFH